MKDLSNCYITFDFISFKTIELVKIAADLLTSTIILTVGKVVAIFCGWGGRIVTGTQPEVKNKTFYKHGVYFAGVVILVLEKVCGFMVFNTIFNNIIVISWQPVLLLEETRVPEENHRPVASH